MFTSHPQSDSAAEHPWFQACCGLLRGERQRWQWAQEEAVKFHGFLLFHGIDCLVFERLDLLDDCPAGLRDRLQQSSRGRALWEVRNRQVITLALDDLQQGGIESLVYKGTALAYSLYANPVWRTRSDTDLLVPEAKCNHAMSILAARGHEAADADDEIIVYQRDFTLVAPEGGQHTIDLHWKLSNSELLSGLFAFDELRSRAAPLPALGRAAYAISRVDALLIACLHRDVHQHAHYSAGEASAMTGDRLVWICDIDRLARALDAVQWQQLFALARAKGMSVCCGSNLAMAQRCLATPLPSQWQSALTLPSQALPDCYLQAGPLRRLWLDLLACPGLSAKARYCRRLLFPPQGYMRHKYAAASISWLPWLYGRRLLGGLVSRLQQGVQR